MKPGIQQLRIKHLQLLDIVHETGSLRRAADTLCVSQPAISAMLKDIEHAFGAPLVNRGNRGADLTAAGKSLRLRLNFLLKGLQELNSENIREGKVVQLRIGAVDATMFDLVPRAIALLHQRNEKIDVRLMDGPIERIVSALIEDRVDCVIGRFGGMRSAAELRTALFEEELLRAPLGIACSPGHPLMSSLCVSIEQLVHAEWILRPGDSQARIAFNLAVIQQGYRPVEPVVEMDSLAANLHMVGSSQLLTVAPRSAIELYRKMGLIEELAIDFPLAISNVSFLCYRANAERESIQKLRSVLTEVARQMSGVG